MIFPPFSYPDLSDHLLLFWEFRLVQPLQALLIFSNQNVLFHYHFLRPVQQAIDINGVEIDSFRPVLHVEFNVV